MVIKGHQIARGLGQLKDSHATKTPASAEDTPGAWPT